MAFGYRYTLERQENGWWLVRFPGIPEALTEGETEEEARVNAVDCVIAALAGYMKAGKPLPRHGAGHTGRDRAVLPSLVTAKLAVYETMRARAGGRSSSSPNDSACRRTLCDGCSICVTARRCGSSMRH
jgi:predicted RNase H-like HicB family nuclease